MKLLKKINYTTILLILLYSIMPIITILMIILSGLLFSLFGSVLNSNNKQKKSRKSFYIVILMTLQMKTITLNVNIKKEKIPSIPLKVYRFLVNSLKSLIFHWRMGVLSLVMITLNNISVHYGTDEA